MFLFDSVPKKVNKSWFKSALAIDLDYQPYTLESIKNEFRIFPSHYFSGWQSVPNSTVLVEFEEGRCQLASTNFQSCVSSRSYSHVRSASRHLQQMHGIPFRTWMASFLSRVGLSRALHYDHYDGILYNCAGRKDVTTYLPISVPTDGVFRYITDADSMGLPTSEGTKFILEAGEALYIPAFAHHLVENVGTEDTAAVSFAFDTSTLLIDIFRLTLEYCTQEVRTMYQPRSYGGGRVYGTTKNWDIWKHSVEVGQEKHWIYTKIAEELAKDVPAAAALLANDRFAKRLLTEDWKKYVVQDHLELGAYINP